MNLNFVAIIRDKVEMAWRHKSKDEKLLLRIILFLCIALIAFITTVAVLDTTYMSTIKDLEDHIADLNAQIDELTADGQAMLAINNKHQIKDLKEEIERLKQASATTTPGTDITEETEDTESSISTSANPPSTTSVLSTASISDTSPPESTADSTGVPSPSADALVSSSPDLHKEAAVVGNLILHAIQQ